MDCEAIWNEANEAAKAAVRGNKHHENTHALDCGYAWVVAKPARRPFFNWLRAQKAAHVAKYPEYNRRHAAQEADGEYGHVRDYGGGGWQFWMPGRSEHNGQSIAVFEAGARAFAAVLNKHGISCFADSRLD